MSSFSTCHYIIAHIYLLYLVDAVVNFNTKEKLKDEEERPGWSSSESQGDDL